METMTFNSSNLNAATIYNLFNELDTTEKVNLIDKIFKRPDFIELVNSLSKDREMSLNDALNWFNRIEPENGLSETEIIDIVKDVRKERYATA